MNEPLNIPEYVTSAINRINLTQSVAELQAAERELIGRDSPLFKEQGRVQILVEAHRPSRMGQIKMNMQLLAEHITNRRRLLVESSVSGRPMRPTPGSAKKKI